MRKVYFIILVFIVISSRTAAQKPKDDIQFKKFNKAYLEQLIVQKINDFRKSNHLEILKPQEDLYNAALDQSQYILKSGKVEHSQPNKKKETPFERALFYDGYYSKVAENVMQITIGAKLRIKGQKNLLVLKSYESVAEAIAQSWINVKDINQIILNTNYFNTAVAIDFDSKNKFIVATQLYATEEFEVPENYKINKEDYNLQPYSKDKCAELEKKYAYLPQLMSDNIFFKDNQIYFYFNDLTLFKDVLKDNGDGIALDIIYRNQYACGSGNKFFPSKIHKGIILPPISKSQIFGKNELKDKNQIEVSLGPIPDFVDTNNVEFNLLLIKGNCLCQTIIYNSLGGKNLHSLDLNMLIDTMSVSRQADSIFNTLEFTIPFELNKYSYDKEDIKPFLDSLNFNKYDLKKIEITAYSSIEGNEKENKMLQQKRAQSIINAIKSFNIGKVETKIITKENWEGFYKSIEGSPLELKIKKLSKDEIKNLVNSDTLSYNLEPYLEDQRKANIKLYVEKVFMDESLFKILPKKLNSAIKSRDYAKAKVYQSIMFDNVMNGKISKDIILKLDIPHLKGTVTLNSNLIAFKWYYSDATNKDSLYNYLERDVQTQLIIEPNNAYLLYNQMVLKLLLWANNFSRVNDPKQVLKDIRALYNLGIANEDINRLILNFNLIAADYYYDNQKFKEREKALDDVHKILLQVHLSKKQAYKIANYFIFQMKIDWAIEIMKPFAIKPKIDENFLYTFISIAIYNDKLVPIKEYLTFLERAKKMNQTRFCKLFGYPNMSFQLLDNREVKTMYCNSCK